MINEKLLIEALKQRIASHEKDADDFKEYDIKFDNEEMLLRLADECQAIIELVDKQPQSNEWIPCSERLPEIEEYILMSLRNLDVAIGFRSNTKDYWYYGGQYLSYDSVVAWMPLPEPYKGE